MANETDSGTNPESGFTSAEQVVENMLSRDSDVISQSDADWSETPGAQDTDRTDVEGEEGDSKETKPDSKEEDESATKEDESTETKEDDSKFVLPKQQMKEYPKDVLAHFAKRFGTTLTEAAKNPALMAAIKKDIDSDIFIAQQQEKISQLEAEKQTQKKEDETKPEEKKQELSPEEQERQFQEYNQKLDETVKQFNDPKMFESFKKDLMKGWGIDISKPEIVEALKAKGADPDVIAGTMSKFGVNLIATALPAFLPQMMASVMENVFPQFQEMYTEALRGRAWDAVRSGQHLPQEARASLQEQYGNLPEYGTKEFRQQINTILKENPWIEKMTLQDGKGNQIKGPALVQEKYAVIAKLMSGQKVTPKEVTEAIETGKKLERNARKTADKGNLAPGKSRGGIEKKAADSSDDVGAQSPWVSEWAKRKGSF